MRTSVPTDGPQLAQEVNDHVYVIDLSHRVSQLSLICLTAVCRTCHLGADRILLQDLGHLNAVSSGLLLWGLSDGLNFRSKMPEPF